MQLEAEHHINGKKLFYAGQVKRSGSILYCLILRIQLKLTMINLNRDLMLPHAVNQNSTILF